MTKGTVALAESAEAPGMTIRVYTVDRHGTITADHGMRTVTKTDPPDLPLWTRVPPCACPLHRGAGIR